jgi:hypothetical protein
MTLRGSAAKPSANVQNKPITQTNCIIAQKTVIFSHHKNLNLTAGKSHSNAFLKLPYFPADNAYLMYNAHPVFFRPHELVV